jgi:hypothetical protein
MSKARGLRANVDEISGKEVPYEQPAFFPEKCFTEKR